MSCIGPWRFLPVLLLAVSVGRAGEPPCVCPLWNLRNAWQARKCWCPDDYHPKPLPCKPPWVTGCVDDYCCKTLPHAPPCVTGCVNDYCPRNCPLILHTCFPPWYVCVPAAGGGCPHGPSASGACQRPAEGCPPPGS